MATIESPNLHWLPTKGVVRLTKDTALVGHGGWADARNGDYLESQVTATDLVLIRDLKTAANPERAPAPLDPWDGWLNRLALKRKLHELGDEAASTLRPWLEQALERYPQVIVLTHVPPFPGLGSQKESSSGDLTPNLSCKAMGDMLLETVAEHPHCEVIVLCGHVHGEAAPQPLPNLRVLMRNPNTPCRTFRSSRSNRQSGSWPPP